MKLVENKILTNFKEILKEAKLQQLDDKKQ